MAKGKEKEPVGDVEKADMAEPIAIKAETEMERAMREVGIAESDLDNRAGQRPFIDHGHKIVFFCVRRAADGTITGHFEKTWVKQ